MTEQTFKRSELTSRLVAYLSSHSKGTRISYDELSRFTDTKITSKHAHLTYARKLLIKEHAQVWVAVRNEGVMRLDDKGIAERLPTWHLRTARSKLKRGGGESRLVDTRKLAIDEQARFAVDSLQQQLAMQSLSRAAHTRLEKIARGNSNDLPKFNALEWAFPLMTIKPRP